VRGVTGLSRRTILHSSAGKRHPKVVVPFICVAAVIVSLGLVAWAQATGRTADVVPAREHGNCPVISNAGPLGPEHLLRAVRSSVPRVYRQRNQSGPVDLSPGHYEIEALLSLQPSIPPIAGATFYRRLASKRCGETVARGSWVVLLHIPEAQTERLSIGVAFFAPTRTGWKLWYRYR